MRLLEDYSNDFVAIVPYVDPLNTGSVSGIVGAGGNVLAVCFGLVFRQLAPNYVPAFVTMAAVIVGSSILTLFVRIRDCNNLLNWPTTSASEDRALAVLSYPQSGPYGNASVELTNTTLRLETDQTGADADREKADGHVQNAP